MSDPQLQVEILRQILEALGRVERWKKNEGEEDERR
jgi:hypothetical protein